VVFGVLMYVRTQKIDPQIIAQALENICGYTMTGSRYTEGPTLGEQSSRAPYVFSADVSLP
jgi:hypothetical protein